MVSSCYIAVTLSNPLQLTYLVDAAVLRCLIASNGDCHPTCTMTAVRELLHILDDALSERLLPHKNTSLLILHRWRIKVKYWG